MASSTPSPGPVRPEESAPEQVTTKSGGLKAWLPLLANILLMPVMAYMTVHFAVLPGVRARVSPEQATSQPEIGSGHSTGAQTQKVIVPLGGKIIVNVAGTLGARYLLANLSLVGKDESFRSLVERSDAALRDAAAGVLSTKTISDLEKPGARNQIRTELITVINNVLGNGAISDLYLTEFAIQ